MRETARDVERGWQPGVAAALALLAAAGCTGVVPVGGDAGDGGDATAGADGASGDAGSADATADGAIEGDGGSADAGATDSSDADAGATDSSDADAGDMDSGDASAQPAGRARCDGLAAGATYDPAAAGPYPVGVKTLELTDPARNRAISTEVWYPAAESARGGPGTDYSLKVSDLSGLLGYPLPLPPSQLIKVIETSAVRDAPIAAAQAANGLVIFSHGYRGVRYQSAFLMVRLASHGYVVAAPDHAGNTLFDGSATDDQAFADRLADVLFVTADMTARAADAQDFFHNAYDPARVAWTGHSFGASTVLSLGVPDPTEMVNVPLAPRIDERMHDVYDPTAIDLHAALLVMGGSADQTCAFSHQQAAYDKSAPPRFLVKLDGAAHFDFTELCGNQYLRLIPQIGDECGPEPGKYFESINHFVTAAMNRYLRCDPTATDALSSTAGTAVANVASYSADP